MLRRDHQQPVRQVVVIGGSLTGLLTAAALAGDGRGVTIVERDEFPAEPAPRPGVPQSAQAHIFLYRGLLATQELLSGLRDDLLAHGSVPIDGGQLLWLSKQGWLPTRHGGYELLSSTRPLLEHVVRQRTLALPGVASRAGHRVSRLAHDDPGWRVVLDDGSSLTADLVVDASGRGSRLAHWLDDLGVTVPPAGQVDAHVGYATRLYRAQASTPRDLAGVVVAATPDSLRGGLALPVEGDQWLVLAIGLGDYRPSRDNEAFEAFLAGLPDPAVTDLVGHLEPVGDAEIYRQTSNIRHPYERVRNWPTGLLAVGDALCAFNPVYGQGISVGAIQAHLLKRAVRNGLRPRDTRRLQRRIAAVVATPWSIATSADLSFPTTVGEQSRIQALLGAWTDELGKLSVHGNHRANLTLSQVYNLMGSPVLLFHPAFFGAALRARLLGYGPGTSRPAALERLRPGGATARVGAPADG